MSQKQGFSDEGAASPLAERSGEASRSGREVGAKKRQRQAVRRAAKIGSDSDETEPSSDEEGSEAGEEGEESRAKKRRMTAALEEYEGREPGGVAFKRKVVKSVWFPREEEFNDDEEVGHSGRTKSFRGDELEEEGRLLMEQLTPKGSRLSERSSPLRVFFKKLRLREAAHYDWPEDLEDDEEQQAMQIEAGYALRRLQGVVGSEEVWMAEEECSISRGVAGAERGNRRCSGQNAARRVRRRAQGV